MLLTGPCTGLNVVDAGDIRSPICFSSHLVEFAVLNHHRVDDAEETLIAREDSSPTSQSVALQESLASMFTEDLDNSTSFGTGELIPLEITASVVEYGIKLVADQFIWGEESKGLGVVGQSLVNESADCFHA